MQRVEAMKIKEKQTRNDMDKVRGERERDETKEDAYIHPLGQMPNRDCITRPTLRGTEGKSRNISKRRS